MHRSAGLARLAAHLGALPPSCGPVRVAAVDGHAGSGKSTFAARLAAALGGAPVVHLDDLATHDELFAWERRLFAQILTPLGQGRPGRHAVYDWEARCFAGRAVEVPCAPVVLLEGVGAGRRAVRPHLAQLLWMDLPRQTAWARGQRRDGPELEEFWHGWMAAEDRHFSSDPSRPFAELLVRQVPDGFLVLPGPKRPL